MKFFIIAIFALTVMGTALASPGAHGPNGEHLDGPAATGPAGSVPRVESFSELFELVGQVSGGELSVMVDRYDTNEPVLNAQLEVQYKGLKAMGKFHADMGDYAFDDEKLIKALAAPGQHALVFTLIAGEESDLLEGTLDVAAPHGAVHDDPLPWRLIALAALCAAILGAGALFVRQRKQKGAA